MINLKISCIKSNKDKKSFKFAELLGIDVYSIERLDDVDNVLDELVNNKCKTIFISNELAGFSQKIMKEYYNDKDVNIIISKSKRIYDD